MEREALKKTLGDSLLKQPTTEEVLNLLDKSQLQQSIINFPLARTLDVRSLLQECPRNTPPTTKPLMTELHRVQKCVIDEGFCRIVAAGVCCSWGGATVHGYAVLICDQLSLAIPPWVGEVSTGGGYGHC